MTIKMPTIMMWRGTKVKVLSGVKKQELEAFYTCNPSITEEQTKDIARKIKHPLTIVKTWLQNRAAGLTVHSCCKTCPTYFTLEGTEIIPKTCTPTGPKRANKRKLQTDPNNNSLEKKIKLRHLHNNTESSDTKLNSIKIPKGLNLKDMQPVVALRKLNLWCFESRCVECASRRRIQ